VPAALRILGAEGSAINTLVIPTVTLTAATSGGGVKSLTSIAFKTETVSVRSISSPPTLMAINANALLADTAVTV